MTLAMPRPATTVPAVEDDGEGPLFEIVDGKRVDKPMSFDAQWTGMRLARIIDLHLEDEDVGGFVNTEAFIACFDWMPTTKRRPDVAYWTAEQMPEMPPPGTDVTVAPAWCVEVVSPRNTAANLEAKVDEYFRAGVDLVWIVHPNTRAVYAVEPDGQAHVYRDGESVPAKPVLPTLAIEVSRLFPKRR